MTRIAFYVPNMIGYCRLLLLLGFMGLAPHCPLTAAACYTVSELLDAVDGHAARYFNQATMFGAVLDQISDRISTVACYILLAALYPRYTFPIFVAAFTDIGGHWVYTCAQYIRGLKSHKSDDTPSKALKYYYTNKWVIFMTHLCYEVFLCGLVTIHALPVSRWAHTLIKLAIYVSTPLGAGKIYFNTLQLVYGCQLMIEHDAKRS